jgi:hypothetical protein
LGTHQLASGNLNGIIKRDESDERIVQQVVMTPVGQAAVRGIIHARLEGDNVSLRGQVPLFK